MLPGKLSLVSLSVIKTYSCGTRKRKRFLQVISCNKNICTLQITDTTGSHQFPAMQRLSISKGHAFILVYSVSSRQSLEELRPIWELIREIKGPDLSQIPVMLVGNKCDESAELREVSIRSVLNLFVLQLTRLGEHIGGTGSGGELGHKFHGDFGEDQSQCEAALPGTVEPGEVEECELAGGRQGDRPRRQGQV